MPLRAHGAGTRALAGSGCRPWLDGRVRAPQFRPRRCDDRGLGAGLPAAGKPARGNGAIPTRAAAGMVCRGAASSGRLSRLPRRGCRARSGSPRAPRLGPCRSDGLVPASTNAAGFLRPLLQPRWVSVPWPCGNSPARLQDLLDRHILRASRCGGAGKAGVPAGARRCGYGRRRWACGRWCVCARNHACRAMAVDPVTGDRQAVHRMARSAPAEQVARNAGGEDGPARHGVS